MTVEISPIILWDVQREAPESAELWDAITTSQLDDWEAEWMPIIYNAIQEFKRTGVDRSLWPQTSHWNWRSKVAQLQGLLAAKSFSIMCKGSTQGLMTLDLGSHHCRIDSQIGKHLVYIDYLENAPWNRPMLTKDPLYRGVGSIFIATAIQVSVLEGFKGRIGLHSLPQSESFYRDTCQMTDLGNDSTYHNLCYFEMTFEQAQAFVQKGE